jgi:hypothetical protein
MRGSGRGTQDPPLPGVVSSPSLCSPPLSADSASKQIHRLRSPPQLARHHQHPAPVGVVLREDVRMDARLPALLRVLRVDHVAGREAG